jgi:hypothetical protein
LGANKGHINNYGFVNDLDYDRNATSPLFAVIGDSYIEAFLVPYENTIHGRLQSLTRHRIYSFGVSGSPLSQYLGYCRYLRDKFKPDSLLINVIGNDFDESLHEYKQSPGYHYFHYDENGSLYNRLVPNQKQTHLLSFIPIDSFFADILRESHLLQYLHKNAKISKIIQKIKIAFLSKKSKVNYIGNTPAVYDEVKLNKSKLVVDTFFQDLPTESGLSCEDIIFTVDGMRQSIYDESLREDSLKSYFGVMRNYFINRAKALGYTVIDLDAVFMEDYKIFKRRFEHDYDWHWNSYGHGVVAEEVFKTSSFSHFLEL